MEGDAPMNHRRQAAAIALLLLPLLSLSPAVWPDVPKSPESFFESIDINVVNVEVYVTDKHGRPVPGLTRSDFELREDGKPVELTNFYAGETPGGPGTAAAPPAAAPAGPAAAAPAAEAPPGVAPGVPDEQRLNLAVFVDNLNLTPGARNRVLGSLKRFFGSRLSPHDRVVLASYDGVQVKVRQAPTNDPKALIKTIDELAKGSP